MSYSINQLTNEYDLMWDALQTQNVSNYKIMCDVKRLNDTFHFEQKFMNDHYLDLDISNIRLAYRKKMYSNIFYDFNINNSEAASEETKMVKFCTLNLKKHFYSKNYKLSYGNFLYKRILDEDDIQTLEINGPMFGGFYQPPYCVQNYLFYTQFTAESDEKTRKNHKEALESIKSHVKQYNYDFTVNREIDSFMKILSRSVNPLTDWKSLNSFYQTQNKLTVIIIPFLRREANLRDLLLNLHSFLQRQYIQYRIIVAEQFNSNEKFNKGRLYNAAFQFIHEMYDWSHETRVDNFYPESKSNYEEIRLNNNRIRLKIDCIVMHDVDLIPESDLNSYKCQEAPRHLSLSIRRFGKHRFINEYEKSPYDLLIGGVLVLKPSVYQLINGFSNEYWNWGAEDDDLAMRMLAKNVCVRRPLFTFGTYAMANHKPSVANPNREALLFSSVKRMSNDGLTNLKNLGVRIVDVEYYALFTHLSIHVGLQES